MIQTINSKKNEQTTQRHEIGTYNTRKKIKTKSMKTLHSIIEYTKDNRLVQKHSKQRNKQKVKQVNR